MRAELRVVVDEGSAGIGRAFFAVPGRNLDVLPVWSRGEEFLEVLVLHDGDGKVLLVLSGVYNPGALNLLQTLEEVQGYDGKGPGDFQRSRYGPNFAQMPVQLLDHVF